MVDSAHVYGKLISTMLIELWEKLRGYDKWIETEAISVKFESERNFVLRKGTSVPVFQFRAVLTWLDQYGAERTGVLDLAGSPLRLPVRAPLIRLRFNPAAPHEFYVRNRRHIASET